MELKERLHKLLVQNPMSLAQLGREIGIFPHLLGRYIREDNYPLQMKTKLLIEKWVQEREKDIK